MCLCGVFLLLLSRNTLSPVMCIFNCQNIISSDFSFGSNYVFFPPAHTRFLGWVSCLSFISVMLSSLSCVLRNLFTRNRHIPDPAFCLHCMLSSWYIVLGVPKILPYSTELLSFCRLFISASSVLVAFSQFHRGPQRPLLSVG